MRKLTVAVLILGTLLSGCIGFGYEGGWGHGGGGRYYHHHDWR
jgi:hypothetical protein